MALSDERIWEIAEVHTQYVRRTHLSSFARAIEAERCKDDEALIRQLVEALAAMQAEAQARACGLRICDEAIAAGRARLEPPWA